MKIFFMTVMTIKLTDDLRQALRDIAHADGHSSSGRTVKEILESNYKVKQAKKKREKDLVRK